MIHKGELEYIGRLVKPHGIKGEIAATIDIDGLDVASLSCLVVYVDGIAVPFFADAIRQRGAASVLIKFDGVDDEHSAAELCNADLYALRTDLPDDIVATDDSGFYASDLIGFTVRNADGSLLGTVDDVDDSTANVLFIISTPSGSTVYLPVADEFIIDIDPDSRTLNVDAPESILNLNN